MQKHLSLYIHLPFCAQKCAYCSFFVLPLADIPLREKMIRDYLQALYLEIDHYANIYADRKILSIYLGGGTPNILGAERLVQLLHYIETRFNLEDLTEFSMELNPYPEQEIYDIIQTLGHEFHHFPRLRFSFGIQTFRNDILQATGRPCTFLSLVDFLRALRPLKIENMVYNLDFIAFGKPRYPAQEEFFATMVNAYLFDSYSLYTLELFPGSVWKPDSVDDDAILEEFHTLSDIVMEAGYHRYETSNFCLPGKSSIHNRVYWNMGEYLGLGVSASSFVDNTRITNTQNLHTYLAGKRVDESKTKKLTEQDLLIESFFLRLRTDEGINNLSAYIPVLVPHRTSLLEQFQKEDLVIWHDETLKLSDAGMDVSNTLLTDLLKTL